MPKVSITRKNVLIERKPFYIIAGDIHYFRIYPGGLKRRLELMKAFGINTVQTYVPWNLHEPEKGEFVFDGLCDLEGFLKCADEMGLKVMLRPSPYICSEWECGGLPYWLHEKNAIPRSHDGVFMSNVEEYYKVLCPKFVPYLATNGGPIIAVALENEYGSYACDKVYLTKLRDLLIGNGVDVPFYTTDGYRTTHLNFGTLDGVWAGVNYRVESETALTALQKFQPDKPKFVGEYWSGRAIHWCEPFEKRDVGEVAAGYKEALENGAMLTFYMFAGGTNFGFMNGADYGKSFSSSADTPVRYIPHTTTYDEDALLNEQGLPTEKYYACRKVLWDYLGRPEPEMPKIQVATQVIDPIGLDKSVSLWDIVDYANAKASVLPLSFEELGQNYGYVLYKTEFVGCGELLKLTINDLHDRADVYVDRVYKGTLMRERDDSFVEFYVAKGKRVTIELLCENMGRINFGPRICEKKGIAGTVILSGHYSSIQLFNWECLSLPFRTLDCDFAEFKSGKAPVILHGSFKAQPGKDTFLDMRSLKKGFVIVNGFNLGRYWSKGPQYTLYVPGELLKEENTIEVFEQYGVSGQKKIKTRKTAILK